MIRAWAAEALPSGPAFTVVLICHVAAVLIGLVALVANFVASASVLASRARALSPAVRRYFAPGVNWAGRALYLIPVFGVVLTILSGGAYPIDAGWVLFGIALWVAAMVVAELVLWPAERRVQRLLQAERKVPLTPSRVVAQDAADPPAPGAVTAPAPGAVTAPAPGAVQRRDTSEVLQACRTLLISSTVDIVIVVSAMIIMFAKP